MTARAVMVFVRAAAIVVLVMVKPHIGLTDVLVVDLVSTSACVLLSWSSIRQTMASLHSPSARTTFFAGSAAAAFCAALRSCWRFTRSAWVVK